MIVDRTACSLCMACVGVCPSGALAADSRMPRLTMLESSCHQCGLCVDACPEHAINLLPRLLCSKEAETCVVLHEEEPFSCIECGVPFASLSMIEHLEDKLAGHWMYGSDRQRNRLRMCRTCRTRDALIARDFQ